MIYLAAVRDTPWLPLKCLRTSTCCSDDMGILYTYTHTHTHQHTHALTHAHKHTHIQMAAQDKLNVIADIKKSGDVHETRRIMSVSDLDVLLY
jgi:hypothetical protein